MTRHLTPPEVAREMGVCPDTVLAWIRSGQLRATNVAADPRGRRPRFRVATEDVELFRTGRTAVISTTAKRSKRRPRVENITRYFS